MVSDSKQYWAFISYSSKDRRWGEWLHRRLESYPIPPEFRGLEVFDGAVLGKNLRPVFRDRDELASSADLGEAIRKALEASRFLVVLCSKNAAKSKWVNKEIEDFQAMGKGDRILALILDGEPNATEQGRPEEECFPPALRYPAEPIAGDLRKEGDGKARGFLKILAGIAQLDFDKLYRRHERARRKRQIVVSAIGVMIVATFALLAAVAWLQKEEADSQRLVAEEQRRVADQEKARAEKGEKEALSNLVEARHQLGRAWLRYGEKQGLSDKNLVFSLLALARAVGFEGFGALESSPDFRNQYAPLLKPMSSEQKKVARIQSSVAISDVLGMPLWVAPNYRHHRAAVADVAVSHDGGLIASASEDGHVRVWLNKGERLLVAELDVRSPAHAVAFSPDGRWLAAGLADGRILIRDLARQVWASEWQGHKGSVHDLAFSPVGLSLASVSADLSMCVWDVSTGDHYYISAHSAPIYAVAYHPGGGMIATGGADGTVRLHRPGARGSQSVLIKHVDEVRCLAFSPDGGLLAAGIGGKQRISPGKSGGDLSRVGEISLWDINAHEEVARLARDRQSVKKLAVESLVFTSDGGQLASGIQNGTIEIWDIKERRKVRVLEGHANNVRSLCLDMNGLLFSGSDDHTLRIWDIQQGVALGDVDVLKRDCRSVAISEDGRFMATGGGDGTIAIWDISTGSLHGRLKGHGDSVDSLCFSPDGRLLASGASDSSLYVWALDGMKVLHSLSKHKGFVREVGFSRDGRWLVSSGGVRDEGETYIWDVRTGDLHTALTRHTKYASCARFSPDGRHLAVGSYDKCVSLYSVPDFEFMRALAHGDSLIYGLDFSPDGKMLAVADIESIGLWDISGERRGSWITGQGANMGLRFSSDGINLVSAGEDKTVRVWSTQNQELNLTIKVGQKSAAMDIALSPGSEVLATAGDCARLWALHLRPRPLYVQPHQGMIRTVRSSPDGKKFVTGGDDLVAKIWHTKMPLVPVELKGHHGSVLDAVFSPDGRIVYTASADASIRVWSQQSGQLFRTIEGRHRGSVWALAITPDGRYLVSAGGSDSSGGEVFVWNAHSFEFVRALSGHEKVVRRVAITHDGTVLATGGDDEKIRTWELKTGTLLGTMDAVLPVRSLGFSPVGNQLACCTMLSDQVQIWDWKQGKLVFLLSGDVQIPMMDNGALFDVQYSPDGRYLAGGANDGTVRIWDIRSQQLVKTFREHGEFTWVHRLDFSPDGTYLFSADTRNLGHAIVRHVRYLQPNLAALVENGLVGLTATDELESRLPTGALGKAREGYTSDWLPLLYRNGELSDEELAVQYFLMGLPRAAWAAYRQIESKDQATLKVFEERLIETYPDCLSPLDEVRRLLHESGDPAKRSQ